MGFRVFIIFLPTKKGALYCAISYLYGPAVAPPEIAFFGGFRFQCQYFPQFQSMLFAFCTTALLFIFEFDKTSISCWLFIEKYSHKSIQPFCTTKLVFAIKPQNNITHILSLTGLYWTFLDFPGLFQTFLGAFFKHSHKSIEPFCTTKL